MNISNKKITLRDWKRKDFAPFGFWNTGEHPWMDFNGPYYPNLSDKELDERIKVYRQKMETKDWQTPRRRLIVVDTNTDQFLGEVSWYWQSKETNWKSIGIVIYDDNYWGKGIGFDALRLWIGYLFDQDKSLVRLGLRTWSGHTGMIKLAEKLGFVEEARFRKARVVKGKYYDSIGMGILREEWEEAVLNFE